MFSKSTAPATKHITEGDLWAVVNGVTADWHPDSKAVVSALATAKQLPAEIKKCVAQTGAPLNTIGVSRHKGISSEP